MAKPKLKMYVWEHCLCSWSSGTAYAYAESLEQAKQLLIDNGVPEDRFNGDMIDDEHVKVLDGPFAFHCWGAD